MATGGQQTPGKDMCPNSESNHGNGHGDRPAAWTLLPNNLELNTRSKPTKKQRNKDKSRTTISSQNLSSFDTSASSANKVFDSIFHTFSDIDTPTVSKRNVKLPVNQRQSTLNSRIDHPSSTRTTMDNENRTSKEEYLKKHNDAIQTRYSHLKDCQAQVDSVLQQLEGSDDPRIVEQIVTMKGIQEDLVQKETLLRNYAKQVFDESEQVGNQVSAFCNATNAIVSQEINGAATYRSEEETANIQNHLLEKVKASQEKLVSLREHQSLLLSIQKKAEDKLASFQAQAAEHVAADASLNDQEWRISPKLSHNSGTSNKASMNGDCNKEKDNFSHSPSPWHSHSPSKPSQNNQQKLHENGWPEAPQDLSKLHVNLDHIKRRLDLLQQLSNQNSADLEQGSSEIDLSSMQDELEDNISLDRRAAIEWERKKLKNTLTELQEKQKINETLKKQLLLLKDASSAIDYKDEESSFPATNISDVQQPYSEENIRTLEDLRETISQLRRMLNNRSISTTSNDESNIIPLNLANPGLQEDTPSKLQSQLSTCAKRDNIRKEQRNQFPARRHYEAEGRANEDSDMPPVPAAAVSASPSPDPNAWENDLRIQEKKRQLESTKQKLQMMQNLVNSIQEARASGQQVPLEFLHVLSSFNEEDEDDEAEEEVDEEEEIDFDDDNTVTDNEESQETCDVMSGKNKPSEMTATRVKEYSNDTPTLASHFSDNERIEIAECITDEVKNLEHLKSERERLVKLQEKFLELQHKLSSPKQNNEPTRCSGEGGNLQEKRSRQVLHDRRSQQNLLTRRNVATVESQNRNNSTNLPKTTAIPLKKDNINDLSAKLTKPSGHNGIRASSDTLNKYNSDAASFSTDLNQSLSLRDEVQHKSVLEHILKHGKNKTKNFVRRDNHVHSNSSVNSEPLDGSSRSFAPDTTVAATWGGSSTQENFEDENEPESVEDVEEEEEEEESNNEVAGNISELERSLDCDSNRCRIGEPFAHFSADSSSKRRDNRLQKYFKSTQVNQWSSRKNFSRPEASSNRNQNLPVPPSDYSTEEPQDCLHASGSYVHPLFPKKPDVKFRKELQYHISKLNALCEPVLHNPQPVSTEPPVPVPQPSNSETRGQGSFSYLPPNAGRPVQTSGDIMQHYTQQLQLQQQLLLSLSQCYHALYVQQLEIQHLGRCLQHNPDSDNGVQPLPSAPAAPSEGLVYPPWFFAHWMNPAIPQMPFAPGQVSPMSAPPFLQPSQAAFTFNPTVGNPNSSQSAPCALVTGMQPARAVVHPDRQNPETLNNQVPPRTRANNFWDNFRSQSRQNLFSSSNTARAKDSSGHFSAPQVRQVHPVVPNESSWSHRSRVFIPPHQENNPSTTHATERTFSRPATDSSFRIACRAKKPNWSRQSTNSAAPDSTMGISNRYNLCPETDQPNPSSSANPDIDHQVSEQLPTLGSRIETCFLHSKAKPSSAASNSVSDTAFDSVQSEIAIILSQNDNQSGYLMELLRELRNLKSDSLQRALGAVRDLVSSEGSANAEPFITESFENSNQPSQIATRERVDSSAENNHDGSLASFPSSFNDPTKGSNENLCQRSNHIWPPATIIPLGKHIPKPSTGAVKKRPVSESVPPTACAWIQASAAVPENEINPQRSAFLENLVAKVIQNVLPFIHSHATEECCPAFRASFCSKVIDALKNGSSLKIPPEFLLQLHPVLLQLLIRYSNLKLMDCQGDLIKYLGSTLYRELELCKSISCRPSIDEGCDSTSTIPKKSAQPDLLPSSSKSFCDLNKQVLPVKEERDALDNGGFFSNSGLQEYENHIGELFINMPAEENTIPAHLSGNLVPDSIRGALSGGCSPPTNSWPSQAINAEEDMAYECEAEAEAEPEVEAGTEADLAEADQSPGQQGVTSNDAWHVVSQISCPVRSIPSSNSEDIILAENGCFVDATGVLGLPSAQAQITDNAEKEICLDDIPTKLSPLSEEDLQKQMSDEQDSNSLLLEVVEPVPLSRNGDCTKDVPPSAPYL